MLCHPPSRESGNKTIYLLLEAPALAQLRILGAPTQWILHRYSALAVLEADPKGISLPFTSVCFPGHSTFIFPGLFSLSSPPGIASWPLHATAQLPLCCTKLTLQNSLDKIPLTLVPPEGQILGKSQGKLCSLNLLAHKNQPKGKRTISTIPD